MDTEVRSHSLTLSHSLPPSLLFSLSVSSLLLQKECQRANFARWKWDRVGGLDVSSAEAPWAESSNSLVYALYNALYALVCRC